MICRMLTLDHSGTQSHFPECPHPPDLGPIFWVVVIMITIMIMVIMNHIFRLKVVATIMTKSQSVKNIQKYLITFNPTNIHSFQLEVWTSIIQKSTVIPPSPMVLFEWDHDFDVFPKKCAYANHICPGH